MDALDFFRATLPPTGTYYLVLFREGNPKPIHVPYTTLEGLAAGVEQHSANERVQVYHACAAYKAPFIQAGDKKKYRVPDNQSEAKAFWVDLDCGEKKAKEGKGYLTQHDAAIALKRFCLGIGLPMPMLVNSGWGVHGYWPLDRAIPPSKWQPIADTLKACMQHAGLIIDPTRSADFASILRPPGGMNRKVEGEPRVVSVRSACAALHPKTLLDALKSYKDANGVKVAAQRQAPPVVDGPNSDLTGLLQQQQFPPQETSGDLCADQCSQMAAMRDTGGDVSYNHWRLVIGVLKHCVDGEQLAEAWTANREATGHDQADWRTRYDTWDTPPATCQRFENENPNGCMGCPHRGKITTPMEVGRIIPEPTTEFATTEDGEEVEVPLPQNYEWVPGYNGGRLVYHQRMPDGTVEVKPFCSHLVWPVGWTFEDGVYSVQMNAKMPSGKISEFIVPYESMASPTDLGKALAKRGAVSITTSDSNTAGKNMVGYMQAQLQRLQAQQEQQNTHKTFGWQDDMKSFLVADRLYAEHGVTKVLVGGNALSLSRAFPVPRGTISGYAAAIDRIYNRPGMEWAQFVICSGFGSLLSPLGEELYKGVIVALQGGQTGRGKTTACQASMFAFGDATELTLGGKDGFTVNGLWQTVATLNNLPLLVDELTNIDPKDFSNMAYGVSNGRDKQRSHASPQGVVLAERARWSMSPFITGNADFHGMLAINQANSQAEAVRMIQLNVDSYAEVLLSDEPGKATAMIRQAVKEMRDNCGVAGDAMIRYIVKNIDQLRRDIEFTIDQLANDLPGTKYRFYRNHAACTLVMAEVASKMGIIRFDLDALRVFTVDTLTELAESVTENNTVTAEDSFSRLTAAFGPHTVVTADYLDGRRGAETPRYRPGNLEVWGRYVSGTLQKPDGRMILEAGRVREWCAKHRVDFKALLAALVAKGAMRSGALEMHSLTRGTDMGYTPPVKCLVVQMSAFAKGAGLSVVMNQVDGEAANGG